MTDEMFTRDDLARAWQEGHAHCCPRPEWPSEGQQVHANPYAAPPLPPEPPEGTIVVDCDDIAYQRDGARYKDYPWRSVDGVHVSWGHLTTQRVPLRLAVPLTDDERAHIVYTLRYHGSESSRAIADRIEGTLP